MTGPASFERRVVTVLFADLVGFTPLTERLDAEDMAAIQDAYFSVVRETVARHGGRLEKFIGDAAMAVFGLPRGREDDAERAVRAGLALVAAVERLGAQLELADDELRLRVGIESGEVVAAEDGPDEGRVTGDTVNTAARLQAAAPPGGVLLGEGAALAAAAAVELELQPPLALKGKARPVHAALARALRPEPSRASAMGSLRSPLIGREAEMRRLRQALARVAGGGSAAVLLVAAPGTGKSRLVGEFLALAERPTWTTRVRSGEGTSLEPLAGLARAAIGVADAPALASRLEAAGIGPGRSGVLADEIRVLAASGGGPADEAADRDARHAAWIEGLDALAGGGPMIWVIEDVHWAGGDLLAFLERASRTPAAHGRLIVATARPGILDRIPDWTLDEGGAYRERLELSALEPAGAARLISGLIGDILPPGLVADIGERSDGNPLFIEELLRTWVNLGAIAADGAGWRLVEAPDSVALPSTVQAIYAAQLDDLPWPERTLARRASVAGRRFPTAALASLDVPEAERTATLLRDRALLNGPVSDALAGQSWSYRHVLLRDVGYASLARAERARLHVRLARWLESIAGDRTASFADRIGGHYEAALGAAPSLARQVADDLDRAGCARVAATWLERAAQAAQALSASDSAIELLLRAVALTDPPDGPDAARRELLLGEVIAAAGDMDAGLGHVSRAADHYRLAMNGAAGRSASWIAARDGYSRSAAVESRLMREQLRFEEARRLAEAALAEIGPLHDVASRRLELAAATAHYYVTDRAADVLPAAAAALEAAREARDTDLEIDALELLANDEGAPIETFAATWRDLETMARSSRRWVLACLALRMQAVAALGLSVDPWPVLDEAVAVAAAHGLTESSAWTDYMRAEAGFSLGRWDAAWTAGLDALELAEAGAYHRVAVRTWHAIVPIAAARGRSDVLERALRWYADHDAIFPDSAYGRLMRHAVRLHFAAAGLIPRPEPDEARLLSSFDADMGGATTLAAVDAVVTGWLNEGKVDAARQALARMEPAARASVYPDSMAAWLFLTGRLRRAEGDLPGAESYARAALPAFRRVPMPPWTAKAIRLLESIGAASPAEVAEAAGIEAGLGFLPGARA